MPSQQILRLCSVPCFSLLLLFSFVMHKKYKFFFSVICYIISHSTILFFISSKMNLTKITVFLFLYNVYASSHDNLLWSVGNISFLTFNFFSFLILLQKFSIKEPAFEERALLWIFIAFQSGEGPTFFCCLFTFLFVGTSNFLILHIYCAVRIFWQ
jgi:hypothetical protein